MTQDMPTFEAELVAFTNEWIAAEVEGDRAVLERLMDERFLNIFASGQTVNRTQYIDAILGMELSPFEVNFESIERHGDTAVVVNTVVGSQTKIMWTAVRRDGDWRVISQTFTNVAEPAS